MTDFRDILQESNAWPVQCAKKLLNRVNNKSPEKGYVLFETGYGPSGFPHIGTFGEVVRTKFVQNTFNQISDIPTKLFVVSDDYDGLRKIPDNFPNVEMLKQHMDMPLTSIPDPFGTYSSYGEHMNNKLKSFLDRFGFDYDFKSATDLYKSGFYDKVLLHALKKYNEIMRIMLPTLGEDRQQTYSPFLPICKKSGKVLYVKTKPHDLDVGTISYIDPSSKEEVITRVTGGECKLQWKPDFGIRWAALMVDFEMYGKDHLANGPLYSRLCKAVNGNPPEQFVFELFLDRNGQKISKSKGNEEVTVDKWLKYAPVESLSLYMFMNPQRAKKLYFEVVPKTVDEYLSFVKSFHEEEAEKQKNNPVLFIHNFSVPKINTYGLSYSLLLNIASACNASNKEILWGFIKKYAKEANSERDSFLDSLVELAVNYYTDFVKDYKEYRVPNSTEVKILLSIKEKLIQVKDRDLEASDIQQIFYEVGREFEVDDMKEYFQSIYQILLGQEQGPRIGSFVALYGIDETIILIDKTLNKN